MASHWGSRRMLARLRQDLAFKHGKKSMKKRWIFYEVTPEVIVETGLNAAIGTATYLILLKWRRNAAKHSTESRNLLRIHWVEWQGDVEAK